jgi:hypothetical protein
MFLKVIACEIAFREICFAAAQSPNILDLEFLTQGHHDLPNAGRTHLQERIDAVPAGKYEAILLGYALCGNILAGLKAGLTPLVIPRAHDCITFFLGSRARYDQLAAARPGTYYYTSGWLECLQRRGEKATAGTAMFLPTPAGKIGNVTEIYERWVKRYGEERARYLLEEMQRWTDNYTHGVLINFEFARMLPLREKVQEICAKRGWEYEELEGDISLFQKWVDGKWEPADFLVVPPGHVVVPSYDQGVVGAVKPADCAVSI